MSGVPGVGGSAIKLISEIFARIIIIIPECPPLKFSICAFILCSNLINLLMFSFSALDVCLFLVDVGQGFSDANSRPFNSIP